MATTEDELPLVIELGPQDAVLAVVEPREFERLLYQRPVDARQALGCQVVPLRGEGEALVAGRRRVLAVPLGAGQPERDLLGSCCRFYVKKLVG